MAWIIDKLKRIARGKAPVPSAAFGEYIPVCDNVKTCSPVCPLTNASPTQTQAMLDHLRQINGCVYKYSDVVVASKRLALYNEPAVKEKFRQCYDAMEYGQVQQFEAHLRAVFRIGCDILEARQRLEMMIPT